MDSPKRTGSPLLAAQVDAKRSRLTPSDAPTNGGAEDDTQIDDAENAGDGDGENADVNMDEAAENEAESEESPKDDAMPGCARTVGSSITVEMVVSDRSKPFNAARSALFLGISAALVGQGNEKER